jgi:hypothetical protein
MPSLDHNQDNWLESSDDDSLDSDLCPPWISHDDDYESNSNSDDESYEPCEYANLVNSINTDDDKE